MLTKKLFRKVSKQQSFFAKTIKSDCKVKVILSTDWLFTSPSRPTTTPIRTIFFHLPTPTSKPSIPSRPPYWNYYYWFLHEAFPFNHPHPFLLGTLGFWQSSSYHPRLSAYTYTYDYFIHTLISILLCRYHPKSAFHTSHCCLHQRYGLYSHRHHARIYSFIFLFSFNQYHRTNSLLHLRDFSFPKILLYSVRNKESRFRLPRSGGSTHLTTSAEVPIRLQPEPSSPLATVRFDSFT